MINKIHLKRDGLCAHRCNNIQTLIEIRKHSQHVNEKRLWEQFNTEGEEGELYFVAILWYQWCQTFYLGGHVASVCSYATVVTLVVGGGEEDE